MSNYFNGDPKDQKDESLINPISRFLIYYDAVFDKLQFYFMERWVSVGILSIFFMLRLYLTQGK